MSYSIVPTKQYRKDFRRISKSGFDIEKLEAVIDLLASDKILPDRLRDHELKGLQTDTRECHIAPDWLLHYAKDKGRLILVLIRTGDHRRVLHKE